MTYRLPLPALLAIVGLIALATTLAPAAVAEDAPPTAGRQQSTLEVRTLAEVKEAIDSLERQQAQVLDNVSADMRKYLATFEDLGKDVALRVNAWIEKPTEENQALVHRAVCEAAARARTASHELAACRGTVTEQVGLIRKGIESRTAQAKEIIASARRRADGYAAQREKVARAALDIRKALEDRGLLGSEDLPPEVEDRLFRLRIDWEDAETLTAIWRDITAYADSFVASLQSADQDYVEIESVVDRIAYRAASAEPVFAAIGQAEMLRISWQLVADAYGRSSGVRKEMASAIEKFRSITDAMRQIKGGIALQLKPPGAQGAERAAPSRIPDADLRSWLDQLAASGPKPPSAPAPADPAPTLQVPSDKSPSAADVK